MTPVASSVADVEAVNIFSLFLFFSDGMTEGEKTNTLIHCITPPPFRLRAYVSGGSK